MIIKVNKYSLALKLFRDLFSGARLWPFIIYSILLTPVLLVHVVSHMKLKRGARRKSCQ